MKSQILKLSLVMICGMAIAACAKKSDSADDSSSSNGAAAAGMNGAQLKSANNADTTQDTTVNLTTTTCTNDVESGLVTVTMGPADQSGPFMEVTLKGYTTTAMSYTCLQTTDNQTSNSSVGSLYNGCSLQIGLFSDSTNTSVNTYAMYRPTTSVKPFVYGGACSVTITQTSPSLQGSLSCTRMVQTFLDGSPRNPVDPGETVDVTGTFGCTFK